MIEGIFGSGFANRIDDKHWQGGFPKPPYEVLKEHGFGVVILCAKELQPSSDEIDVFPGVDVILAPMDDSTLTDAEAHIAQVASRKALPYLDRGQRVLVSCAMGLNRSGLVSALILMRRRGMSGEDAVHRIQMRRENALTNRSFVTFLRRL